MTPITRDRISGSTNLIPVLDLGDQAMTGTFPKPGESVPTGPLELLWCPDSGLLQLSQQYDAEAMFGAGYGYRSGLNAAMVKHLREKAAFLSRYADHGDVVLDIGSNDGTLLNATHPGFERVGMDPTIAKFRDYYAPGVLAIPEFFSAAEYMAQVGRKAKVVSMVACFYDLLDPVGFCCEVASILADGGVFHIEVADAEVMIARGIYDGICHEHACYYTPRVLELALRSAGFRTFYFDKNEVNGGSFNVTASLSVVAGSLTSRRFTLPDLRRFARRVERHKDELQRLLDDLAGRGKRVAGYGASTKFNVVLQYCKLDSLSLGYIADVNPDKWGRVTPGSGIPIIPEDEMRADAPDYLLVGPYHFRTGIMQREQALHDAGTRFIFPFPEIEIV